MPKCVRVSRKYHKPCIGDLNKRVTLQNRALTPPPFGSVDFNESFTNTVTVWALINTVQGKTFFDGVETEKPITHDIIIRYDASVTTETWILYNSKRIDILRVTDLDENQEYMLLLCSERGPDTKEAAKV